MTRQRARQILRDFYGANPPKTITSDVEREIRPILFLLNNKSILATLQEAAGDDYGWRSEPSFDKRAEHFKNLGE